jgi:hypothetical protein
MLQLNLPTFSLLMGTDLPTFNEVLDWKLIAIKKCVPFSFKKFGVGDHRYFK